MSQLNKTKKVRRLAEIFSKLTSTAEVGQFLGISPHQLTLMAEFPAYRCFTIPKKNGGNRIIEDPQKNLKKTLQRLNDALQCSYFCYKTHAAYGFLINPDDDPDPRNILTNAQKHIGKPWLLNVDYVDFFHSVSTHNVANLMLSDYFSFDEPTALLLAQLTTYNGRLPMGAPTSPVLSNWAARVLDTELLEWAYRNGYTYTRFADDLTFSGNHPILQTHVQEIRAISTTNGFTFNENKLKICSPSVEKSVTGLLVGEKEVSLPADFIAQFEAEISKLKTVLEVQHRAGKAQSEWVEKFKEQLTGHSRFASFVLGDDHPEYRRLQRLLEMATTPSAPYDSASWLHFNYF